MNFLVYHIFKFFTLVAATNEAAQPIWRSTSHINKGYPEPQLVEFVLGRNLLTLNNPDWKIRRKIQEQRMKTNVVVESRVFIFPI